MGYNMNVRNAQSPDSKVCEVSLTVKAHDNSERITAHSATNQSHPTTKKLWSTNVVAAQLNMGQVLIS